MFKQTAIAITVLALTVASASAATFRYSYEFGSSADVVTGTFEGELLGDGNRVRITDVNNDLRLNGVDFSRPITGVVPGSYATLDGSDLFFAIHPASDGEGFIVATGMGAQYRDSQSGNVVTDYGPLGQWSLHQLSPGQAPVPLPASLPLLATTLGGGLVWRHRNRIREAVAA